MKIYYIFFSKKKSHTYNAVSYTHLDVYKRQQLPTLCESQELNSNLHWDLNDPNTDTSSGCNRCVQCGGNVSSTNPWSLQYNTNSREVWESWLSNNTRTRFSFEDPMNFWTCFITSKILPLSFTHLQLLILNCCQELHQEKHLCIVALGIYKQEGKQYQMQTQYPVSYTHLDVYKRQRLNW